MVEAALVFPIVILSVCGVIYMLIFFYETAETRAAMHTVLKAESGKTTHTVTYLTPISTDFSVYRKNRKLYCETERKFSPAGILGEQTKRMRAEKYIDDEAQRIRYLDLVEKKEKQKGE